MKTLLLDVAEWDVVLDSGANLAIAEAPYQLAQDVASAVRTFLGEVWYDTTLGIPYLEDILGRAPAIVILQDAVQTAALTVPGVVSAVCQITGYEGRAITGQVLFVDESGQQQTVSLT